MMIRKLIAYIFLLLLFAACRQEETEVLSGSGGWLSVEFLTDKTVETRAEEAVYRLSILQPDGTVVAEYPDCSSMTERIFLTAGTYRLIASSGEETEAAFEKPFYQARQEVEVKAATSNEVAMVCTQANVKVTVAFSEAIRNNFKDYSLTVENGKGALLFAKEEKRAGYLNVNEGTLVWNLLLDNGQEVFKLNKTVPGVKARQHYKFTFDIKEDGNAEDGAFMAGVTVDTTTQVFDWVCNIVLKEDIARPEMTRTDGKAVGEPYLVLEKARGAEVQVEIAAQARMSEMTVRHKSEAMKALGLPESFCPTKLTTEVETAVKAAGVTWSPASLLDAQQATLDFSGLANRLPLGEHELYLSVYDARCRLVTDTLRITVIPDIDHIADEANVMEVWAKFATLRGRWYTIDKPQGMALEYSTDRTNWMTAADVSFDESAKTFSAYLKDLQAGTTYYFRTTDTEKGASETIRSFTTEGAEQIPYLNFDTWYQADPHNAWYLGEMGTTKYWDSGNGGANTMSDKNPTAADYNNKVAVEGNQAAARLETKVVFNVMAAGNIYTGDFVKAIVNPGNPGAQLEFGIPYTCRPTSLKGYYKYRPVKVSKTSDKVPQVAKGDLDSCHIYIALFAGWTGPFQVNTQTSTFVDLGEAIAFGEVKASKVMDSYEYFDVPITYRDKTRKPAYALIVATASKYGDYFVGGEGSVLWIDEFELGFDPVE